MTIDPNFAVALGGILGSGGIAWGVVRTVVSDIKDRAIEDRAAFKEHEKADAAVHKEAVDRLARIETKLNIALGIKE